MNGIVAPQPIRPGDLSAQASDAVLPLISSGKKTPKSPKAKSPKSGPPSRPPSRTERRFTCTFTGCDKAYLKPSRLAEHILTHTGERPHVCKCGQSYLRASHLAAHQRTHKSEADKEYTCLREGCGKKFWTATHLARHEAAHDNAAVHACTQCEETFPKSHLLREHVAAAHMPAGSKPWACTHEGCGRSFDTKQKLRTHEKTHDPTRYTCSHPIHGLNMPSFPVWSALQTHIRDAHPPTCPHAECEGRAFKNAGRLREHLRVHAEREADLAAGHDREDSEDLPPVLAEATTRRKKRKLSMISEREVRGLNTEGTFLPASPSGGSTPATPGTPKKLPRLTTGEAGKDWTCGAPGCGARFKSRFARDEHAQASHSTGRHKCDECGRSYRRPASLKRHRASGLCEDGQPSNGSAPERARIGILEVSAGDLLTGTATLPGGPLYRRWACPYVYQLPDGEDVDEDGGEGAQAREDAEDAQQVSDDGKRYTYCPERFHRVYDVRRHLAAVHKMVLSDMATREMLLADGQTGEDEE
ncbi:uncharacterized protein CcaverHIS019_0505940 [Cutaneotrichosporon cavernicola]|uniref:C2H2-type domain-containing protein n=1 Tax=Cutaneotrichosporon cavernicola TaxID=279322 RepID=A0AA48L6S0_9TREE|nr:uncharacterized protein CcaverHIS019_0505940 [Cutaneotrichosporon cavernicola]BEI92966.1 hypothetical protein CcaverHIS019_0505940 [Cutaneotrichosporon cavernicola]BEJ00742.1 hypothetical protein CcaverHIS631_0505990 [Cutaneotrichosporon cavernicola]BEJ08508.1 hypothetical protein CcaverHIS641_0506020 [Cutaneotrichosporon cavernicola]